MNYKIEGAINKTKKYMIIYAILWLFFVIVFIMPMGAGAAESVINGKFNINLFFQRSVAYGLKPFSSMGKVFLPGYFGTFISFLWKFTFAYIIVVIISIIKNAPKNEYADIEHGSSDWSQRGEQYRILSNKKGIILGEDNYLPVDKRGNVNVLVVGGSGSGKSASYSIPNAYQMLGSYVFTDPKGELYDTTAGYLKNNGYEIKVLNLVDPRYSDGYNPLHHISSSLDVDVIANTIVKGQQSDGGADDPFWDNMAEMLLKALIYYLKATRPEEEQNLASCAELVRAANNSNRSGNDMLTELMNELPEDHPARTNYGNVRTSAASEKTYSSILASLQSKLGKFDSQEIAELTSTDTINFEDIATRKTAVYVISSDTHTAYDFILTIFFSQMIQQLYDFADKNGGQLPMQTYFILDEFANIGRVPDFDKKISTSRSRKISFSVILQNLDQLEAVYEKSYETIIGNCDTHVFLGSNSQKTVEYFSKALGEKTIVKDQLSKNRDRNNFWTQGYNVSDQSMARALMTPDELRRMDNDTCIIFVRGLKPIKTRKYYYFEKPRIIRDLRNTAISHNAFQGIERGAWRKFNPYNPYVSEEVKKEKAENLNIESLDDLFEDNTTNQEVIKEEAMAGAKPTEEMAPILPEEPIQEQPAQPQMSPKEQEEKDLQEELEAKFDELFGPVEDNE